MVNQTGNGSNPRARLRTPKESHCIEIKAGEPVRPSGADSTSEKPAKGPGMQKIAIILHAEPGTHDAMGRALHSMLYARELKEAGHDARLIFDGGGTKWIEELARGGHPLSPVYDEVKDIGAIAGVCEYCIRAFGVDEENVRAEGLAVCGEYMGHPSIAALAGEGFLIITL